LGLPRTLERVYRILCSGLLFLSFGVGAVMLAGLVLPVVAAVGRDDSGRRALRAQRMIQRSFRLFIWMGMVSAVWRVRSDGAERLRQPGSLVVANHPTLIDVVILVAHMPQADCVVKREAWSNPFLRGIVRAAGYIPNDGGEALVEACSERLRAGRSVLLFPEGSRSPPVGLGPFKRGAARVALASGCPVTPVVISCVPPALKKGQPWYALPNRRFEYRLSVGAPMEAAALVGAAPETSPTTSTLASATTSATTSGLAARRATAALRAWFRKRLTEAAIGGPGASGAEEVASDPATEGFDGGAKFSPATHREPGAQARTDERSS
jgi:1-acyl-sn-glycerol-3-phosphate acyltransferase